MKKKNRMLILSGIATTAISLGTMSTIVSCGKHPGGGDEPETKDWIEFEQEQKSKSIEDGSTHYQIVGNTKETIKETDNIKATVKYDGNHTLDLSVVYNAETSVGTKTAIFDVTLYSQDEDPRAIQQGTYANYNLELDLNGSKQTVEGFSVDFKAFEADIQVVNENATTVPSQPVGRFTFDLKEWTIPGGADIVVNNIGAKIITGESIDHVETYPGAGGKYWQIIDGKLVIWFQFVLKSGTEIKVGDYASFIFSIKCVSSENSNDVYWTQDYKNPLTLTYSTKNSVIYNLAGTPDDHEAGTNSKEYDFYFYEGIGTPEQGADCLDLITITASKIGRDDVKMTFNFDKNRYQDLGFVKYAPLIITYTDLDGKPLTSDAVIQYELQVSYDPSTGITEPDVFQEGEYFYVTSKINMDAIQHPKRATAPGANNESFDLNLLATSPDDYVYEYTVQAVGGSRETVSILGSTSAEVSGTLLSYPTQIIALDGSDQLSHGDYVDFVITTTCLNSVTARNPVWKQTTPINKPLRLTYRDALINCPDEVNTKENSAEAEVTVTLPEATYDQVTYSVGIDPAHSSGVESISYSEIERKGNDLTFTLTLVPNGEKLDFNSYALAMITFQGVAPKYPSEASAETVGWSKQLNLKVSYDCKVRLDGSPDLVTAPGSSLAKTRLVFNPSMIPLSLSNISITPVAKSEKYGVKYYPDKSTLKGNELTVVLELTKNGEILTAGDKLDVFALQLKWKTADDQAYVADIGQLSLTYTSMFKDVQKEASTEPGEYTCQYKMVMTEGAKAADEYDVQLLTGDVELDHEVIFDIRSTKEQPERFDQFIFNVKTTKEYVEQTWDATFDIVVVNKTTESAELISGFKFNSVAPNVKFIGNNKAGEAEIDPSEQTKTLEVQFPFEIVNEDFDPESDWENITFTPSIIETGSTPGISLLPNPELKQDGNKAFWCVALQKTNSTFVHGDHVSFQVVVSNSTEGSKWSQTISGFTLTFIPAEPVEGKMDQKVTVQTTYKGDEQTALKAVDSEGKGLLKPHTPAGSHYFITFDREDWESQTDPSTELPYVGWKIGSYTQPETSHVGYYHYTGVKVSLALKTGELIELKQTVPSGKDGDFWVSQGGPITVVDGWTGKDVWPTLDSKYGPWVRIIFDLYLAEETGDQTSSFYVTYA